MWDGMESKKNIGEMVISPQNNHFLDEFDHI